MFDEQGHTNRDWKYSYKITIHLWQLGDTMKRLEHSYFLFVILCLELAHNASIQ